MHRVGRVKIKFPEKKIGSQYSDYKHCVKSIYIRRIRIFPHSNWTRRDSPYLSVLSPNARNADQNNSEYGYFSRCEILLDGIIYELYLWVFILSVFETFHMKTLLSF